MFMRIWASQQEIETLADNKIFAGFGVVIAILVLVIIFQQGGDEPDVKALVADEMSPISEAVAALDDRVDGIEGSISDLSRRVSEGVASDDIAAVKSQIDALATETGALDEKIAKVQSSLAAASSTAEASEDAEGTVTVADTGGAATETKDASATEDKTVPSTETATNTETDTDNAASSASQEAPQTGLTPGETGVYHDGALRVFISRLDAEAGEAHVSANGTMKTLRKEQGRTFAVGDEYCRLTLQDVTDAGVEMNAICGDDLPAAEGISPGETETLQDGALRVFASLVQEDEARLAINGALHTLAIGRSAPVMVGDKPCRVYLDALDRGHAQVTGVCGAEIKVSDLAGPGSTIVLADGAARVFVASVIDETVRFAVNGQTLISGGSGDGVTLESGCKVVVEDVSDGAASFSHTCDG